jgi:hypothetical protein
MKIARCFSLLVFALGVAGSSARAEPVQPRERTINDLRELRTYINGCFAPVQNALDADLTLRFSLRRDGALIGAPHISYDRLPRDKEARKEKLATLEQGFARCLPAPITEAMGGAIAGRMIALRFSARRQ